MKAPVRVTTAEMSSVTFARLVLRVPGSGEISVAGESARIQFLEALRANGYPAMGAESVVFDQDSSDKALFALGGTADELECAPVARPQWRRCRLGIRWELLDRRKKTVVYRTTTRHLATGVDPDRLGAELVQGAFQSLLARPAFASSLKKQKEVSAERPNHPAAAFKHCRTASMGMPGAAERALEATVLVESGEALGSGVLISPDGLVLTAAHVLADTGHTSIQLRNGTRLPAIVVRSNRRDDVALLRADSKEPTACLAARSEPMRVGDEVYAIGSPLGKTFSFTLTRGIVSGFRQIDDVSYLQTDASVNRGNSGGPFIDSAGRWTAITSWKAVGGGVEGIAFGVPLAAALSGLGLQSGEATDPLLSNAETAANPDVAPSVVDDPADPSIPLFLPAPPRAVVPEKPKPPRTRASLNIERAGWIASGVGIGGVVLSWAIYNRNESSMPSKDFDRTVLLNDIGWGLLASGAIAVVAARIMPPKRETSSPPSKSPPEAPKTAWMLGVGPGSARFQMVF